jgi:hypothetical protein
MRAAALILLLCPLTTWAQNTQQTSSQAPAAKEQKRLTYDESLPASSESKGAWDFGVWGGGGHTVSGGVQDVGVMNAGVRIGKILTEEHGSGWYRGNFEYAIDLIPAYVFFNAPNHLQILAVTCPVTNPQCGPFFSIQRGTTYGGGFNPFDVRWNFAGTKRISPYFELNGGVLFTNHELPVGTSTVNFVSGATVGVNIFTRMKRAISLDIRYAHISNAGLSSPNPGLNTVQGQIGYHWFK